MHVEGAGTIMRIKDSKFYYLIKVFDKLINKFPSISTILIFISKKE